MTRSNIQCFPPFPSPFFFSYANQIFSFSKFFSFSSPVLAKYFPSPNIFLLFLFLCYELSFSTPSHNMDIGGGVVIIVGKGQTDRDRQPWYCYQAIFPAPCKEASFFLHLLAFLTTPWAKIYTNVVFPFSHANALCKDWLVIAKLKQLSLSFLKACNLKILSFLRSRR